MTIPHGGAQEIWRDGEGPHRPTKSQIRDYFGYFEGIECRRFDSVNQMVSDVELSYTPAESRVVVGVGHKITAGPHEYLTAAAAATNHHMTTTGGVKLYAQLGQTGDFNVKAFGAVGDGDVDDTAAIQAAIDAASSAGGAAVLLPVGDYLTSSSLVLHRSCGLIGAGTSYGGQRGGGSVNHPITIRYSGTGSAVKFSHPAVNIRIEGFAVVAETAAANYHNFTGIEFNAFNRGLAKNIYVEGAVTGFDFSCADRDINVCRFEGLRAYDCTTGFDVDFVSTGASPFMQGCYLSVYEAGSCGTGIHFGGGQQNHNRLVVESGQIGGNDIGIHVDAQGSGTLTWTLEGNAWLENNANGNIVLDDGILYASGDITGSDNNVSGGFIQNGGRLIPLGRTAFDDYSIPFKGFTKNGLVRAWSFADEGDANFHCVVTGARAQLTAGGTKVSANTRFGDGVLGDGSGGGLRVRDNTFDWTTDWTLAIMCFRVDLIGSSEITIIQKNVGPSFLKLFANRGFVTVHTKDNGGGIEINDLNLGSNNVVRAPFWVILSYDSVTSTLSSHAPNGTALTSVVQPIPAGLTNGNYENWSLNGSLVANDMVIDELLLYDRVLEADEIMAIQELSVNAEGATGQSLKNGISRSGTQATTTNASGLQTAAHGLLSTPDIATVTVGGDNQYTANVLSIDATNITVLIKDAAGDPVISTAVQIYWRAEILTAH